MRKQNVELIKRDFGNNCNLKVAQQMLLLDKKKTQTAQGQFKWVRESPCFTGLQLRVVIQHLTSGSQRLGDPSHNSVLAILGDCVEPQNSE